jgi:hypothetical protein
MPEAGGEPESSGRNGRAAGPRKSQRPSPRRTTNPPDGAPDGDAAFVNGGAVYSDPYRPRREPDAASDAEATHRIADRQRPARRAAAATAPRCSTPARPARSPPSRSRTTTAAPPPRWASPRRAPKTGTATAPPVAAPGTAAPRPTAPPPSTSTTTRTSTDDADDYRAKTDRVRPPRPQADDPDDHPAGLPAEPKVRSAGSSAGQAWAAVVAQWIAGAIGGAALWVGFRFLWRDLPVVALAAAVLVTVGLVLVVRALMHNDDRRTTLFAVLVGLLLTVSPAILVLSAR